MKLLTQLYVRHHNRYTNGDTSKRHKSVDTINERKDSELCPTSVSDMTDSEMLLRQITQENRDITQENTDLKIKLRQYESMTSKKSRVT